MKRDPDTGESLFTEYEVIAALTAAIRVERDRAAGRLRYHASLLNFEARSTKAGR